MSKVHEMQYSVQVLACVCMFMSLRVLICVCVLCYVMHLCESAADAMSNLLGLRAGTRSHIYILHRPRIVSYGTLSTPDLIYKSAALQEEIHLEIVPKNASQARSSNTSLRKFANVLSFKSGWKLNEKCLQEWMDADREMITHRWSFGEPSAEFGEPCACLGGLLCVWGAYCVFGEPSASPLGISPLLCDLLG